MHEETPVTGGLSTPDGRFALWGRRRRRALRRLLRRPGRPPDTDSVVIDPRTGPHPDADSVVVDPPPILGAGGVSTLSATGVASHRRVEGETNAVENTLDARDHIVVAETKYPYRVRLEDSRSSVVSLALFIVSASIDLDRDTCGWDVEVDDKCAKGMLRSNPDPQLTSTKALPQPGLSIGHPSAQLSCTVFNLRSRSAHSSSDCRLHARTCSDTHPPPELGAGRRRRSRRRGGGLCHGQTGTIEQLSWFARILTVKGRGSAREQ